MRITILVLALLLIGSANAQPINPVNPPIRCVAESNAMTSITDLHEISGTVKMLWIVCTADSGAIPQSWPLYYGIHNADCGETRLPNPSTYRMPSWATDVFDSTYPRSLSSYYVDQSRGRFRVSGKVVGQDCTTVFRCDPDTSLRPRLCDWGWGGGTNFFNNIMGKVDAVVNFAEYLPDSNSTTVDFVLFNIYGMAEAGHIISGGGVSGIYGYPSNDTNRLGQRISINRGVTFWSASEQVLSVPNPILAAYWMGVNVAAHESGHHLCSLSHTFCDHCGGGEYGRVSWGHVGCGSFDVMGYENAFPDSTNGNAAGGISPYNPAYRIGLGWMNVTEVSSPLLNYVLSDHLTSDACLKIPAFRVSGNSDQYFTVTAVTRRSPWDRFWPADGVMIEHINPQGNQDAQNHKEIDMELASGLFDWSQRYEMSNPDWGCRDDNGDTCFLYTGENTGTPNSVSGLDSFDFVWNHTDSCPSKVFIGAAGNVNNFYRTGMSFTPFSNPSSAANENVSPYNQDLPTMASLEVLDINPLNGTCTINA
jgi:M6 family metalloprotease-like protein